jgi:hypothetical protein
MTNDFGEEYTKVQATIEDNRRKQAVLKAQEEKLAKRLATLAIGRRFQRAGVTRRKDGWYVAEDGKVTRDA